MAAVIVKVIQLYEILTVADICTYVLVHSCTPTHPLGIPKMLHPDVCVCKKVEFILSFDICQ